MSYYNFKMKMKTIAGEILSCCDEVDELSKVLVSLKELLNKCFTAANHFKNAKLATITGVLSAVLNTQY